MLNLKDEKMKKDKLSELRDYEFINDLFYVKGIAGEECKDVLVECIAFKKFRGLEFFEHLNENNQIVVSNRITGAAVYVGNLDDMHSQMGGLTNEFISKCIHDYIQTYGTVCNCKNLKRV